MQKATLQFDSWFSPCNQGLVYQMCSLCTGNSTAKHDFLIPTELLRPRKAAGNIFENFFFSFVRVKWAKSYNRGKKLSNCTVSANHGYFIGNDRLTWNRLFWKTLSFRVPFINVATGQTMWYLMLRNIWVTIMIRRDRTSRFIFVSVIPVLHF